MKKFNLYGKKDNFEGVLAIIYVKDNKVVVESPDKIVKEILETDINKTIEENGGGLFAFTSKNNKKEDEDKLVAHIFKSPPFVRISDEDFIEAICSNSLVQLIGRKKDGQTRYGFCVKLRKLGYQISIEKSIIVEG